jgi:hypothetical protein
VVITDYPDPELVENIRINITHNVSEHKRSLVDVQVRLRSHQAGFPITVLRDIFGGKM